MKKTIKRNNIKVPAYTKGSTGTGDSTGGGSTPGTNGSAAGNGLTGAQVGAIGQGAVQLGGMLLNSFGSKSTARTQADANKQTASGILSGVGQGASIGAAFGPWGAAIGGAIGGVVGSIGQKGKKASMTSFTDYDEGTLSTGLMGAFGGNNKLKRERRRIKSNAYSNRMAVEGTENLAYEFAEENTMGGVNSFKDGGQVKQPVYMSSPYDFMGGGQEIATDTKEVGYNPQTGEIKINPKYGKEGSDLIHRIAQPGEYWFGKLVNPETGNTFKEDARSIIKKSEVKGTRAKFQDKRTAEINNNNRLEQLDALADIQNRVHQEQNTKPKVKRSVLAGANGMQVPAYDNGLSPEEAEKRRQEIENYFKSIGQNVYGWFDKSGKWMWDHFIFNPNAKQYVNAHQFFSELGSTFSDNFQKDLDALRNGPTQQIVEDRLGRKHIVPSSVVSENKDAKSIGTKSTNSQQRTLTEQQINETFGSRDKALGRYDLPIIGSYHSFDDFGLFNGYGPISGTSVEVPIEETQAPIVAANVKANTKPTITEEELAANKKAAERPEVKMLTEAQHNMILNGLQQGLKTPDLHIPTRINNEPLKKMNIASPQTEELEKTPKDYSWIGDLAGTAGQLAAAMFGYGAKPEIEDGVYNPYHRTIMNTMRDRRARLVEGAMADNARERAMSNYNLTRTGANTGRNLAAMTQSAVNAADAIAKVRLQEDNVNNQYRGEEAEMLNNLGQQWVDATNLARTYNAQSRANALMRDDVTKKSISNILAGGIGSYNTKLRDKQLLPLYAEFLKSGFAKDLVDNITV